MAFRDRTYCVSPDCKNECGRQMSHEEKEQLKELAFRGFNASAMISCGYFCGKPDILEEEK